MGLSLPTSSTLPRGLIVVLAVLAFPGGAQATWEHDPHYLQHRHREHSRTRVRPADPRAPEPAREQVAAQPPVEASPTQPDTTEAPETPVLYPGERWATEAEVEEQVRWIEEHGGEE